MANRWGCGLFKDLGSQVVADGRCERDVWHRMRMYEGYKEGLVEKKFILIAMKEGINANCLYEEVIVPTALYGADAWATRSVEIVNEGSWMSMRLVLEKFGGSVTNG